MFNRELKKGSTELVVLALLEHGPRHGYEIGKLIELRSGGSLQYRVSALYPILCRLEDRGWVRGKWIERPNERRRRHYSLTAVGRRILEEQRNTWQEFTLTINKLVGLGDA